MVMNLISNVEHSDYINDMLFLFLKSLIFHKYIYK